MTRKAITTEIKDFIKYLKSVGITQYTDDKNNYLYSIKDKIKMPVEMLRSLYNKKVGDNNYSENKNYILASLDNVIGFDFIPNGTRLLPTAIEGLVKLNTYKSYNTVTDGNNDMTIWTEYLNRLFPDAREQKMVVQYLAHMFQKPLQRPSWHLLFTSDSGTGKGFLFSDILTPLLCKQVSQESSYAKMTAKHSSCFDGTMLLMLDDPTSNSATVMTQLKSKLSETSISIERKYEAATMQKVYTRVMLASNELRPLRLEENERRWFATSYMQHLIGTEETQAFITSLAKWLDEGGLDAVHNWFMAYGLEDFNHKSVYQTKTLKEMIANSTPVEVDMLKDFIADNKVFQWDELKEFFTGLTDNLLKKYLIEQGYKHKRTMRCKKRYNLWYPSSADFSLLKEEYFSANTF